MPIPYINTGSSANKGDGDTLRSAFSKSNAWFKYLESVTGITANADLSAAVFTDNTRHHGITVAYNTNTLKASLTVTTATTTASGIVKIGAGLAVTPDGTISTLPITTATTSTIGGIKIGGGLAITTSGELYVTAVPVTPNIADFIFSGTSMLVSDVGGLNIVSNSNIRIGTSSTAFTLNGSSKSFLMPGGGSVSTFSSGDNFTIRNLGQITFADNTVQTTAYTGGTNVISSLTNNGNVLSLTSTGTTTVPGQLVLTGTTYRAYANAVNSSTVTISAGFGATPVAGWKYNGVTILSVTPQSGAFSLQLASPVVLAGGYYPLLPIPPIGGGITFPDGTVQTTASGGSGNGSVVQQATPPIATTSTLWYDTVGGRSYVYYDSGWVDASPMPAIDTTQLTTMVTV